MNEVLKISIIIMVLIYRFWEENFNFKSVKKNDREETGVGFL